MAPNVILLVWDACRRDVAYREARNLQTLADSNLRFDGAVAPARWSLPSHASMFSGEYPSQHGLCTKSNRFDSVPLVRALNEAGYRTYGVSSNPFASARYGFDRDFDEFYFTLDRQLATGIDVFDLADELPTSDSPTVALRRFVTIAKRILDHDHPIYSTYNVFESVLREFLDQYNISRVVPHPFFKASNVYRYDPERNTRRIRSILNEEAETDRPFFLFSNYLDAHRPYFPPKRFQREELGQTLSFREIMDLNESIGDAWRFVELDRAGEVSESQLHKLRQLYRGEVRSVDDQLGEILAELERFGLRDETLIVVTADHGEDLGEETRPGERRMGHAESVSDNLLRVPLVMAHPALEQRAISDLASIKELTTAIECIAGAGEVSTNRIVASILPEDDTVFVECPPLPDDISVRYPGVHSEVIQRYEEEHTCVAYRGRWKIALSTKGDAFAWGDGEICDPADVPSDLVETCGRRLNELEAAGRQLDAVATETLDAQTNRLLKDLGYL